MQRRSSLLPKQFMARPWILSTLIEWLPILKKALSNSGIFARPTILYPFHVAFCFFTFCMIIDMINPWPWHTSSHLVRIAASNTTCPTLHSHPHDLVFLHHLQEIHNPSAFGIFRKRARYVDRIWVLHLQQAPSARIMTLRKQRVKKKEHFNP